MSGTKLNVGQPDPISGVSDNDIVAIFPQSGRSVLDNAAANTLAAANLPEHIQVSQLFNRFVTPALIANKINALTASPNIASDDRFVLYKQLGGELQTVNLSQITAGLGSAISQATTTTLGTISLATQDEVNTGTNNQKALTPLTFRTAADARYLTQANADLRYYTQALANTTFLTISNAATTYLPLTVPQGTQDIPATRVSGLPSGGNVSPATTTAAGVVELATDDEARTGTDTDVVVTPNQVRLFGDGRYRTLAQQINYAELFGRPDLFTEAEADAKYRLQSTAISYNDLTNRPTIPSITGLITQTAADARYRLQSVAIDYADIANTPDLRVYLTTAVASNTYIRQGVNFDISRISGLQAGLSERPTQTQADARYRLQSTAIDYNDLANRPTIPSITGLITQTAADARYRLQTTAISYNDLTNRPSLFTQTDADGRYLPLMNTEADIPPARIIGGVGSAGNALNIGGQSESIFTAPAQTRTSAQWTTTTEQDLTAWTTGNTSTTTNAAARSGTDIILREAGAYYIQIDGSVLLPYVDSIPSSTFRYESDVEFRVYRDTDANQAGQVEEELLEDVSNIILGFDNFNASTNLGDRRKEVRRAIYKYYPAGTRLRIRYRISNEFYSGPGVALGLGSATFTDASIGSFAVKVRKFNTAAATGGGLDTAAGDARYRQLTQQLTTADLGDDIVTLPKLAPGTAGMYLGFDASGNPAELTAPTGGLTQTQADARYRLQSDDIIANDIAAGAVGNQQLANNSVNSAKILNSGIDEPDLAPNAVSTRVIADASVTSAKLADGAAIGNLGADSIPGGYLQRQSVIGSRLGTNAIGNRTLADNAVTGAKIANATITADKFAAGVLPDLSTYQTQATADARYRLSSVDLDFNDLINRPVAATTAAAGLVRLSTPAEALAGTNTTSVTTPADVKSYVDNNTAPGNNGIGSHQFRFPIDTQISDNTSTSFGQAAEGQWETINYRDSAFNSFERFIIPDAWTYELGTGHTKISFTLRNSLNTGYDGLVQRRISFYRDQTQTGSLISSHALPSVTIADNVTAPTLQVINVVVPANCGAFAIELNHATDDTPNRSMTWQVSNLQLNYEAWEFAVSDGDLQITYPGGFRQDIAINEIESDSVADGSITTQKLADNAVTSTKIANNAVTRDKINDLSVTSSKIGARQVGTGNIADNAITTAQINDRAVTRDKLADNVIPAAPAQATTTTAGIAEIAEGQEVRTGIDNNRIVTAAGINSTRSLATDDNTMWKGSVVLRNSANRTAQGFSFLDSWNFYPNVTPHTIGQTRVNIDYEIDSSIGFGVSASTGTVVFTYTSSVDSFSNTTRQITHAGRNFNVGFSMPQDNDRGRARITLSKSSGSGGGFMRITRVYTS